ncbi:unnamed protein product [Zymoseptoria tritici ST99CH_3D1]|nr:unnamed protein product [Zymoseptoria tritici ST99CH_3D1]
MPVLNPTFKRDDRAIPGRSPSPPRRYYEPLSPRKPAPIEPVFNYPAVNNDINYHVRPEHAYGASQYSQRPTSNYTNGYNGATPKSRNRSSTIEQLAEAALSTSSTYIVPASRGHAYAHPAHSEPPHKRSRSEMLPSPLITQYASRPATSYEQGHNWSRGIPQQQPYPQDAHHDSRVEEAALLLNFRTGGWQPTQHQPPPPTYPIYGAQALPRPHANSFPQDTHQPRPLELAAQADLLPPFNPQQGSLPRPTLPSPQQTIDDSGLSPKDETQELEQPIAGASTQYKHDIEMLDAPQVPQQTQTPPEDLQSPAASTDVTMSEATEPAPKAKRGWPKGKPRNPGGRKTVAEKAVTKRAATRKKTPDAGKANKIASKYAVDEPSIARVLNANRRKSMSTAPMLGDDDKRPAERRASSVPRDTPMIIRSTSSVKASRKPAKPVAEIICAGCAVSRESAHTNGELDEWISCNGCKNWFHVDCAGFKKALEVRDVDKYFCATCEPTHGKTTYVRKSTRAHASVDYAELQRGVLKTSEESVEHHYIQPIKDGTFQFDPETFPRMRPELITRDFFERSGTFTEPICIPAAWNPRPWLNNPRSTKSAGNAPPSKDDSTVVDDMMPEDYEYEAVPDDGQDKLGMIMPEELTVRQVCNLVGADTPLDVIDVKTQNSGSKWTLGRWADYYEEGGDDKPIRNVISLEVSQTKLGRLLRRPKVVRDIDLQDEVWPQKEIDAGKWPKVQYYCLMSVADSYTDFHIDFGGSSVYYHILKGKKTFFFIPPKTKHLKAYEEWNDSPQQNYTFLPSITKECYRVDLSEGDTMLIPSGWIHAVWTPETSLVIGGNFLTRMSFKNQFKVAEIEKANETPMKFRYPFFQRLMWYTAIRYMDDDPMPAEVSKLFHDGKQFERELPTWADFDGDIAANDPRPGAKNTRYYGQNELDGLPDLVNFIFRTVMMVMGRVEGITADRQKRVNASIPKGHGHGEPLELARTFALWVAWKRGNEDPPTWAHPDGVLPNSKEEGPPKKLSARALKEMERKEAIAAWRVAPDRQSARVRKSVEKPAATERQATPSGATFSSTNGAPATADHQSASNSSPSQSHHHQFTAPPPPPPRAQRTPAPSHPMTTMSPPAPAVGMPMNAMMNGLPGAYLSTPKTSVLGPKRVACDTCRKRRIRCKHKDMVMQTSPDGSTSLQYMSPEAQQQFGIHHISPELHDNITVTPQRPNYAVAMPGTNAYINANIPMAMNGVPMFGEFSKRGRSKACFECRKSKRRCVHDEQGNVDPTKAMESPVPRASASAKKRPANGDASTPAQPKKKRVSTTPGVGTTPDPNFQTMHMTGSAPQQHQHVMNGDFKPAMQQDQSSAPTEYSQHPLPNSDQHAPALDPSLFAYAEVDQNGGYTDNNYNYAAPQRPQMYQYESLEQIASQVLDMNGDQNGAEESAGIEQLSNGQSGLDEKFDATNPDGSVDSGISLPGSDSGHKDDASTHETAEDRQSSNGDHAATVDTGAETSSSQLNGTGAHLSVERADSDPSFDSQDTSLPTLPLYHPPAPVSQSPELSRRQPILPNGSPNGESTKRKRGSMSQTSGAGKGIQRIRTESLNAETEDEMKDRELALALQQEGLGLRRR